MTFNFWGFVYTVEYTVAEYLAPVVRKVDNAILWINPHPLDSVVCFVNTYQLDSDLSGPGCSKGG